ncbi:MAG: XRE family transcriptional regulator [Rikenellaceae bacterium]
MCLPNNFKILKMGKMTEKDQMSFRQLYDGLPDRSSVKAPKTEFVEHIAKATMKSTKTVRCWLAGAQVPDPLTQSIIEQELGVSCKYLFPKEEE